MLNKIKIILGNEVGIIGGINTIAANKDDLMNLDYYKLGHSSETK
jgi:hypothetical protein